ncbi:MAG: hypothetical protein ACM3PY_21885 [Omnitrophica WOR_2 bacterium]
MKASPINYEIKVEGLIDGRWTDWFNGMAITYVNSTETILAGELSDQTALHGVLEKIRDLGLNLISVNRKDGNRSS